MFERKKYKQFALMQLKGRWGVPVFITVIAILIGILFSLPQLITFPYADLFNAALAGDFISFSDILHTTSNNMQTYPLLDFVSNIAAFIFLFAATKLYIKLSQSPEKVTVYDYIQNFTFWGRGILAGLWETLWLTLWAFVAIPIVLLISLILAILSTLMGGNLFSESLVMIIIPLITLCTVCVIFIIKGLSYSMITCVAAEHESCSIPDALRISKIITKGHKWDLFVMELSFIGWKILTLFTLGIGNLWLSPYINMTKINAYHALLKMAFEENKIYVEDFGK